MTFLYLDLKSANILLDDSYNAKVCDFGLSRLKAKERSMTGNCGTVQWMAPEVSCHVCLYDKMLRLHNSKLFHIQILSNQHYAEPADVYSYGMSKLIFPSISLDHFNRDLFNASY